MHKNVQDYCESIKAKHPQFFKNCSVLDVWSLDINGNNRYLFEDCEYIGIDLWEWPWVDKVIDITEDEWNEELFDTVISTEMLEHCKEFWKALKNMTSVLKSWWLLLITSAWEWRPEHWTTNADPSSAPYTNNWYRNILESDFTEFFKFDEIFTEWEISKKDTDIRFYWIKK